MQLSRSDLLRSSDETCTRIKQAATIRSEPLESYETRESNISAIVTAPSPLGELKPHAADRWWSLQTSARAQVIVFKAKWQLEIVRVRALYQNDAEFRV